MGIRTACKKIENSCLFFLANVRGCARLMMQGRFWLANQQTQTSNQTNTIMATTKRATRKSTSRRRRAVAQDEESSKVSSEMKELAVAFYSANKEANEAKNKASKARAELLKKMKDAGVKGFDVKTILDNKEIILDAEIKPGRSTSVIDPVKFRDKVEDHIFMACATIGVTKAKALVPTDVVAQCSETKTGDENVNVGPRK